MLGRNAGELTDCATMGVPIVGAARRARTFFLAIGTFAGAMLIGAWTHAPAAQACHTALHCAQQEVQEKVQPFLDLVPEDSYSCLIEGRSTTWTYLGGFPKQGDYRFEGDAKCVHLDGNSGSDGSDDTGARLTGTFELAGEHSQLLWLPACTMQLDGLHVDPVDYSRITLSGDSETPLVFRHEMLVSGGQGTFELHDDNNPANGTIDGYGAVSLVPTDVVETPGTNPGCATTDPPGFFIEGVLVVASYAP